MTTPKRIQLRRTRGWRKPEGAIVVARPTRWGNPFAVAGGSVFGPPWSDLTSATLDRGVRGGDLLTRVYSSHSRRDGAVACAVDLFSKLVDARRRDLPKVEIDAWLIPLRGHDLACWCPLEDAEGNRVPCHADVLLELANGGTP